MIIFETNIINIFGLKGKKWLEELPEIVQQTASKLGLRDLAPMLNLSYNYVLQGFQADKPIILKLGLDIESLKTEAYALKCFAGYGGVSLIAGDEGMLLLERIIPGTSLKSYFPNKERDSIHIAVRVMKELHQAQIPENHHFLHIKDWLAILDKEYSLPFDYVQKARKLRDQLLKTAGPDVLLHGDLHHDNILQNSNGAWVVIDPKGVIGEAAYEIAAFIRNPMPDLLNQEISITQNRIDAFAGQLAISPNRIRDWCFVQAVLCWIWSIEDGWDTKYWERIVPFYSRLIQ